MRVRLLKNLAQRRAGQIVDYRQSEAEWLIFRGAAEPVATAADYVAAAAEVETEESVSWDSGLEDSDVSEDGAQKAPEPEDLEGLTLAELQARATALGLPTYGRKAQIAARILAYRDKVSS